MKENKLDEWQRRDNMGNTNLLADLLETGRQLRSILSNDRGDARTLEEEQKIRTAGCMVYNNEDEHALDQFRQRCQAWSQTSSVPHTLEFKEHMWQVRTWMASSTTQVHGSRKSLYEGSGPRYIVAQTSSYRKEAPCRAGSSSHDLQFFRCRKKDIFR